MLSASLIGCKNEEKTDAMPETVTNSSKSSIVKSDFATMADGTKIEKYKLTNANGMEMDVITFGGIITKLTAPDKNGKFEDIVLSYTTPEEYFNGNPYFFGGIIGRYGNRIAKGKFTLNGNCYQLTLNDGPNSLHGGKGFDKRVWTAQIIEGDAPAIKLSYNAKDGEEGYPGNIKIIVTYTLSNNNALEIDYEAESDKKTIINLTQHSYFNLSGNGKTIEDHELFLAADKFLPVDATLIPTGELKPVKETPFDFTSAKAIGRDIDAQNDQLKKGQGYDHCWVFTDAGNSLKDVGVLYHAASGRLMTISTTEPAIQFYSGNFLDGSHASKTAGKIGKRSGLCLETQHYPDSPNQPKFPTTTLNPGEKYRTKTVYTFSAK